MEDGFEELAQLSGRIVTSVRSAAPAVSTLTSAPAMRPRTVPTASPSQTPHPGATPTPHPTATPTPTPAASPALPGYPPVSQQEASDQVSWLEGLRRVLTSPDTYFNATTDDDLLTWLRNAPRSVPDLVVTLPILRGMGLDEVIGPISRTYDGAAVLRTIGRTAGDVGATPLLLVGYGLTIGPNLVENVSAGASWTDTRADLLIDSGGFAVSELVGLAAGVAATGLTGNPALAYAAKLGADIATGMAWEVSSANGNWDDQLSANLEQRDAAALRRLEEALAGDDELRVPTPTSLQPKVTPRPPGYQIAPVPDGTPTPSAEQVLSNPVATPGPSPIPTP